MMGEPVGQQDRLFYEFDLEEVVPDDHLLRKIDAVLDLSWLRGELKLYYSHLGCPSVCPELMGADASGGLLLLDPLGAAPVPGGGAEPGLSLVLRLGP